MPTHESSNSAVRFEGGWSPTEREVVREAIQHVEAERETTSTLLPSFAGANWLCVVEREDDRDYYFAHWMEASKVLAARSPEGLADEIETAWAELQ